VVGRPIRDAADPQAAVERIVEEIEAGLRERRKVKGER
jgi:orotidine-5'-phosphate decarboxylase